MKKTIENKLNFLNQHGKPTTRRDFISLGLAAGGAAVLAPTLGSFLSERAQAQVMPASQNIPFIVFDLAGGAALFANFLVGNQGGPEDLLTSYSKLGWNPRAATLNRKYGIPMPAGQISQLLVGLESAASPQALDHFKFATLLHKGDVDTSVNPLSAASLVNSSTKLGKYIDRTLGLRNTISGGNSRYTLANDQYKAFYVSRISELENSVGASVQLKNSLNDKTIFKLGRFLNRLSQVQSQKYLNQSITQDQLKTIDQHYHQSALKMSETFRADARQDSLFQKIYNISPQTDSSSQSALRASVVRAALMKQSGPAVITIDGCDYHDNTQTTGDLKDLEIGLEIGKVIEAAYQLKTPVFIQIITDGGIYPAENSRVWLGDTVDTCMSVMGYYNPDQAPQYLLSHGQIGSYTNGQGVNRNTLIGDSPMHAGYAVFANYLSACGRIDDFKNTASGIFTPNELKNILVF